MKNRVEYNPILRLINVYIPLGVRDGRDATLLKLFFIIIISSAQWGSDRATFGSFFQKRLLMSFYIFFSNKSRRKEFMYFVLLVECIEN